MPKSPYSNAAPDNTKYPFPAEASARKLVAGIDASVRRLTLAIERLAVIPPVIPVIPEAAQKRAQEISEPLLKIERGREKNKAEKRIADDRKRRSDLIKAVIIATRDEAPEPKDVGAVWSLLKRVAQSDKPPSPIIGYDARKGIEWESGTEKHPTKFMTRVTLRKRLDRLDEQGPNPPDKADKHSGRFARSLIALTTFPSVRCEMTAADTSEANAIQRKRGRPRKVAPLVQQSQLPRLLNREQIGAALNCSRQKTYDLETHDADFPAPIFVGTTPLWLEHEVFGYVQRKADARASVVRTRAAEPDEAKKISAPVDTENLRARRPTKRTVPQSQNA